MIYGVFSMGQCQLHKDATKTKEARNRQTKKAVQIHSHSSGCFIQIRLNNLMSLFESRNIFANPDLLIITQLPGDKYEIIFNLSADLRITTF